MENNLEVKGNKEEAWRGPRWPEVQLLAGGNGGEAWMIVAAWGHEGGERVRGNGEGGTGFL